MKKFSLISITILCFFFWKSFIAKYIIFSNDGPLGAMSASQVQMPGASISIWQDLNYLGGKELPINHGPSGGIRILCQYFPEFCIFLLSSFLLIRKFKIKLRKFVGVMCFIFAAICIFAIIGGIRYEAVQAITEFALLFFFFALVFVLNEDRYVYPSISN